MDIPLSSYLKFALCVLLPFSKLPAQMGQQIAGRFFSTQPKRQGQANKNRADEETLSLRGKRLRNPDFPQGKDDGEDKHGVLCNRSPEVPFGQADVACNEPYNPGCNLTDQSPQEDHQDSPGDIRQEAQEGCRTCPPRSNACSLQSHHKGADDDQVEHSCPDQFTDAELDSTLREKCRYRLAMGEFFEAYRLERSHDDLLRHHGHDSTHDKHQERSAPGGHNR